MNENPLKGIYRTRGDKKRGEVFERLPERRTRKPLGVIARAWAQHEYKRTLARQRRTETV